MNRIHRLRSSHGSAMRFGGCDEVVVIVPTFLVVLGHRLLDVVGAVREAAIPWASR